VQTYRYVKEKTGTSNHRLEQLFVELGLDDQLKNRKRATRAYRAKASK
jgi:hypothetical protein